MEQMKAAITTAEADLGAATAMIALARPRRRAKSRTGNTVKSSGTGIKNLVARKAIEAKLGDEEEDHYQAAVSAELAAGEAVVAAKQKEAAARARVTQAQADLKYAEAEVATAKARLEKSQVLARLHDHPFTLYRRGHQAEFPSRRLHPVSRCGRGSGSVLTVERTDVMRVVIQVPERDVPFVDCGIPAVVEVDALPGVVFKTRGADKVEVSRLAASEDPHTRMMRTEVHVKNTDGKLRRGMFGRVTLTLQPGLPSAFRSRRPRWPARRTTGRDGSSGPR